MQRNKICFYALYIPRVSVRLIIREIIFILLQLLIAEYERPVWLQSTCQSVHLRHLCVRDAGFNSVLA